jgi:hypothetical protein
VGAGGLASDEQLPGDLLIGSPSRNQVEDPQVAPGQAQQGRRRRDGFDIDRLRGAAGATRSGDRGDGLESDRRLADAPGGLS